MNFLKLTYLFIITTFIVILIAIMHLNMLMISTSQNETFINLTNKLQNFKQTQQPHIDRSAIFDRLIDFFNLFKSAKMLTLKEETGKLSKFFKTNFPEIYQSPYVKVTQLNSSFLFAVGSELLFQSGHRLPFLIGINLDNELYDNSFKHEHFQVDYVRETISGIGTMSSKSIAMSLLEALTQYLSIGHIPSQPFFIIFLKDGNMLDHISDQSISEYFRNTNIRFEFILESPGAVLNGSIYGLDLLVAVIGVTRKGYIAMELTVNKQMSYNGGSALKNHFLGSFPLQSLLTSISANSQCMFGKGIEISMLEHLSKFASYPFRLIYSNLWFFKPLLSRMMLKDLYWRRIIKTNTILRNYHFIRMTETEANVDQIVHPNVDAYALKEVAHKLAHIEQVNLKIDDIFQPMKRQYDYRTEAFLTIANSFHSTYPDSIVIPGDSYMHARLSPIIIGLEDMKRYQTNLERLSLTHYINIIRFYFNLFVLTNNRTL